MSSEKGAVLQEISEVIDFILIALSFYVALFLYQLKHNLNALDYLGLAFVYFIAWIIGASINKVYQSHRFMSVSRELRQMVKAHFFTFGLTMILLNLYDPSLLRNRFFFYFEAIAVILMLSYHILIRLILQAWRRNGKNIRHILIIGSGSTAELYLKKVRKNPQLGYKVIGYLAPSRNGLNIPYLGDYSKLESVISLNIVDLTVVTARVSDEGISGLLEMLDVMGKTVAVFLDDVVSKVAKSRPIDFDGLPMVVYDSHPQRPWQEISKRTLDFIASAVGLIILGPLMLIISAAIKLTSKGPIIFEQERIGLNGRSFKMYKFRSMIINAEELKDKLTNLNEMSGPVFKIKNDPRVTTLGAFLRKTSLDELPQLWNVLNGSMSLVGPRPPLPKEVNLYDPKHRKRLAVKPGITCIWQVSGRNDVDFEEWMEMDADYVSRWSFWLDVKILIKTIPVVLMRKGAS